MAKNWSAAEAARVVFEGKDKAAIMDIGKRFPLFVSCAARGTEGLLEIIGTLHPERITARTIEAKLKESVEETDEDEDEDEVEAPPAKKPAGKKEDKKPAGKKKPEVEDEDEDEDEDEAPKKPAKGGKKEDKKPASKKPAKPVVEEDEDEDEDEDEETTLEDMSLAELKAEAKKRKVDIKGLKSPKEIIKAIKASEEDEDGDEDEDDDDWDL